MKGFVELRKNDCGTKNRLMPLIAMLLLVLVLFPYVFAAFYACPSADDFNNLTRALSQKTSSYTINSILASVEVYFGWQGAYTATLFAIWGGAIYWYGGLMALRIEYIFGILFFFFAVGFVLYRFLRLLGFDKLKRLIYSMVATSVFGFIALYNYNVCEIFYWHTGIAAYTIPVSFTLLTIGLLLNGECSRREAVFSYLLSFLAAGGALDISAFVTGSVFLIAVYKGIYKKKIDPVSTGTFLIALVGSIINVVSPGNFIRHSVFSDEFPVFNALDLSIGGVIGANLDMFKNGTVLLVLFICFFIYNDMLEKDATFQNPFILGSLFFLGSIIIDFPVFLGYAGGELQLRGLFVRKVSMTLFYFVFAVNLTGWIANRVKRHIELKAKHKIMLGAVMAISVFIMCAPMYWNSVVPFKIWCDMMDTKAIERFEYTNKEIISILSNSPNEDVIIYVDSYDDRGYLKGFGLKEDKDFRVNQQMSKYYGNKSIVFRIGHHY